MLNVCNVVKVWILQATPWYAILMLFTIACYYVAIIRSKAHRTILCHGLYSHFTYGAFNCLGLSRADFSYIFPLQRLDGGILFKHRKKQLQPYMSFEIILIAFPKVNGNSVAKLKAISIANGFVTLFYTFTVWICFIVFSPKQIELIPEPSCLLITLLAYRDYRPD